MNLRQAKKYLFKKDMRPRNIRWHSIVAAKKRLNK
jgi:hypothetical protein